LKEEKEEEYLSPCFNMNTSTDIKAEPFNFSSDSHTYNDQHQNFKLGSNSIPPSTTNGTASMAPSPPTPRETPPAITPKRSHSSAPQLISDLLVARTDALASFNEISENNYQNKSLGRSREVLESMTCDCSYEHGQLSQS
jgi:[histone H3]-lysine36 N-trimethyltransferase